MNEWQPIETAPKDGSLCLWYLDFKDGDPAPGPMVAVWREDPRGFNIKCPNDGGAWHSKGIVAWMPLPNPPVDPNGN
jgi:hypothetical protein